MVESVKKTKQIPVYKLTYQHLQRGAKWFLNGVNSPSLRVLRTAPRLMVLVKHRFFTSSHMGVSKNRGTPKWINFIMENPNKIPWIWGAHPYFWKHPYGVGHLNNHQKNKQKVPSLKLTWPPENRPGPKRKQSSSSHPCSGAKMVVSGRVYQLPSTSFFVLSK